MAAESKPVIIAALAGNCLIALTKFVAAAITGSSAMFSEGIHSVVDTGNQGLLLLGLRRAKRPPDEEFPFGHGKEIYFWGFIVAILIFAVGAGLSLYEGVRHIIHPHLVESFTINYIVLGLAVVFEGFAWAVAFRAFRKAKGNLGYIEAIQVGKDPTMFIVLMEDSAAMAGILVAGAGLLAVQLTGIAVFDGLASILIGLILAATAAWLAYETKGLLIGESANRPVVRGIRHIVTAHDKVLHTNEVLTMHMGPEYILANISVDFRDSITAAGIEATISEIEARIREAFPAVKRVFIEAEAPGAGIRRTTPRGADG
jgi:cation diffusion facilitator family transporter